MVAFYPDLSLKLYFSRGAYTAASGIVVKNYIDQSQEFVLCAVALAYPMMTLLRANRIWLAALLAAIAVSFLVNMMFVVDFAHGAGDDAGRCWRYSRSCI